MLKDILVHMDRGVGCTARLMASIDLARRHNARLKGLYVITHPHYTSSSEYLADFSQVREFFINATSKAGVLAEWQVVDWGIVGTPLHSVVTSYSYHTDLVLVGQPAYLHKRTKSLEYHEHLLLTSGRPVVVFPAHGEIFKFGEKITIAWKGGRESARAVHDALPLLQTAAQVTLLAITENRAEQAREEQSLAAMLDHLRQHQVEATATTLPLGRNSIVDLLLPYAAQTKTDLLVIGAFAYKSNRAPVLSPLTRELLIQASIPLLIAH